MPRSKLDEFAGKRVMQFWIYTLFCGRYLVGKYRSLFVCIRPIWDSKHSYVVRLVSRSYPRDLSPIGSFCYQYSMLATVYSNRSIVA